MGPGVRYFAESTELYCVEETSVRHLGDDAGDDYIAARPGARNATQFGGCAWDGRGNTERQAGRNAQAHQREQRPAASIRLQRYRRARDEFGAIEVRRQRRPRVPGGWPLLYSVGRKARG